jgi:alpha-tubulin suppressor-like RCC1 family protein
MHSKHLLTVVALLGALTLVATTPASGEGAPDPAAAEASPEAATSTTPEAALTGVVRMTTSYYHTCALLTNRQVRCSGDNDYGQLGTGTFDDDQTTAVAVRNATDTANLTNVIQIAAGGYHTCALLTNRQVRCWGFGGTGELGDGDTDDESLPVTVSNPAGTGPLQNVVQISSGEYHTCAVIQGGQLRCWGGNEDGRIGDGTTGTDRLRPRRVLSVAGSGLLTGVSQVEAGYYDTCARLTNGQARCWGYNDEGQLGNNSTDGSDRPVVVRNVSGAGALAGVRRISVGTYHVCAVLNNGQARCWGYNTDGVFGDGTQDDAHLPVVVENGAGTAPLSGIAYLDAAYYHSCALLTNHQVRCWGENLYDQVGNGVEAGPDVLRPTPVRNRLDTGNLVGVRTLQSSDYHTCVSLNNRQARCWGYDDGGALGNGGTTQSPLPVIYGT